MALHVRDNALPEPLLLRFAKDPNFSPADWSVYWDRPTIDNPEPA